MGKGNGEVTVLFTQRFLMIRYIRSNIPCHAIGIGSGNYHTGRIKCFAGNVGGLCWHLGYFYFFNGAAKCHQVGRVIFEIDRAVFIYDGAADGILGVIAGGRKQCIRSSSTAFCGYIVHSTLTRLVPQGSQLAGSIVIKEIHIGIAAGCFIGRCKQAAGLGITLRRYAVRNRSAAQINDRNIVSGIGRELTGTGNTNIGTTIVNHGRTGTHGRSAHTILQTYTPFIDHLISG